MNQNNPQPIRLPRHEREARAAATSFLALATFCIAVYHLIHDGVTCIQGIQNWYGNIRHKIPLSNGTKIGTIQQIHDNIYPSAVKISSDAITSFLGIFLVTGIAYRNSSKCSKWIIFNATIFINVILSLELDFYALIFLVAKSIIELFIVGGFVLEINGLEEQGRARHEYLNRIHRIHPEEPEGIDERRIPRRQISPPLPPQVSQSPRLPSIDHDEFPFTNRTPPSVRRHRHFLESNELEEPSSLLGRRNQLESSGLLRYLLDERQEFRRMRIRGNMEQVQDEFQQLIEREFQDSLLELVEEENEIHQNGNRRHQDDSSSSSSSLSVESQI